MTKESGPPVKQPPRYIDTVTLSTGEVVDLLIPTMGEIYPHMMTNTRTWLEVIIPAATQRPWEWFLALSLFDGSLILHKLTPAFKAMSSTIDAVTSTDTRH